MDTLIFSANAVLPIILLVTFGFFLRKKEFLNDSFVSQCNSFVFQFCFPCQMFVSIYSVKEFNSNHIKLIMFSCTAIMIMICISFIYAIFFVKEVKQKGVIAQSFYRSNYVLIGTSLASLLYGMEGMAAASIVLACTIPLYTISAVIALTIFLGDKNQKINPLSITKKIITNPQITGIIVGVLAVFARKFTGDLRIGSFKFIYSTISNIAQVTSPVALTMLGAQFHFSSTGKLFRNIAIAVFVKLIFSPILGLSAVYFLFPEFKGPEYAALVPLFGSPVAIASAIMAEQMHNDGELARQIVVWSTFFSMFTLFAIISFFRHIGIF